MKTLHDRDYKLFIDLLKQYRVDKGITQVQLGNKLGKDQTYISKYETFERRIDFIEFRDICLALEIPIHQFLDKFEELLSKK